MAHVSPKSPPPDTVRSRLRLPHWGWFLFATVTSVIAFVGLSIWLPWHREQQAIQVLRQCGGWNISTKTVAPEWLRQLLGNERMTNLEVFERVTSIEFYPKDLMTDAQTFQLRKLTNLAGLSLDDTSVTDAGLANLSELTDLGILSLRGTAVTDAGLAHLNRLKRLYSLSLDKTAVIGKGLVHLGELGLVSLDLRGAAVTDAGLVHVCDVTGLCRLDLSETAVTNAGLADLKNCRSLEVLHLEGTAVTEEGVQKLQTALPDCVIVH